jgi:hypothetical protein
MPRYGVVRYEPASALLIYQILLEELELVEILFIATEKGDISALVVTDWFDLLRESLGFSNQRSV